MSKFAGRRTGVLGGKSVTPDRQTDHGSSDCVVRLAGGYPSPGGWWIWLSVFG